MKYNKNVTATIFNIQKFSIHDGPGIRTVVFLKGCPLHCGWCANPESQSPNIQILWNREKCLRCSACIPACPQSAISMKKAGIAIDFSACDGCKKCVAACPGKSLKAEGERKTVEEVLQQCLQDIDFYEESNGGVTLSGGEALMQPEFANELQKALKEYKIHTAMETTGFASASTFQRATTHTDLLLFDIKHWNTRLHKEGTGVSNRTILENMKWAISNGKEVLPRLPVIPGYNNRISDAEEFVSRLKEVGSKKVQLLPFHQFGENKYRKLGKKYAFEKVPAIHEEDLADFRQVFLDHGMQAFF